jgi:hypothetical protein
VTHLVATLSTVVVVRLQVAARRTALLLARTAVGNAFAFFTLLRLAVASVAALAAVGFVVPKVGTLAVARGLVSLVAETRPFGAMGSPRALVAAFATVVPVRRKVWTLAVAWRLVGVFAQATSLGTISSGWALVTALATVVRV